MILFIQLFFFSLIKIGGHSMNFFHYLSLICMNVQSRPLSSLLKDVLIFWFKFHFFVSLFFMLTFLTLSHHSLSSDAKTQTGKNENVRVGKTVEQVFSRECYFCAYREWIPFFSSWYKNTKFISGYPCQNIRRIWAHNLISSFTPTWKSVT